MEASLSEHELNEWIAFSALEPFGEFAAYHRAGIVAAAVTNPHIGKDRAPVKPSDFMAQYAAEEAPRKDDLTRQARAALAAVFGGGKNGK